MFVVWQKASPIPGMPLFSILYIFYFYVGALRCFPSFVLKVECLTFLICDTGLLAVSRWVREAKQLKNSVEPAIMQIFHCSNVHKRSLALADDMLLEDLLTFLYLNS